MDVIQKDDAFYRTSGGGVTFGGGEPTAAGDFLLELMDACIAGGYHTCLDSCGYCAPEMFAKALQRAELVLFDCKHMDPRRHKELTGKSNELILANLRTIAEKGVPVRVRIPLIPGANDDDENLAATAKFLLGLGIPAIDVLPCHHFGWNKYRALGKVPPLWEVYQREALREKLAKLQQYGITPILI